MTQVDGTERERKPRRPPVARRQRIGWTLVLLAVAVGLAALAWRHLSTGFGDLSVSRDVRPVVGPPIDLRLRWAEWRAVFEAGMNPFDIYLQIEPEGPVDASLSRPGAGRPDPTGGEIIRAPYPAWFYPMATPVLAWPWPAARWVMAGVNLLSLVVLAAWSARLAYRRRPDVAAQSLPLWPAAIVLAALPLAPAHHYTILRLGQVSLVVVTLLVLCLVAMRRAEDLQEEAAAASKRPQQKRWIYPVAAGMLLGLAMLKPTSALPFVLVPLVRRQWGILAACIITVAFAAGITWAATGSTPWLMWLQMQAIAEQIEMGKGVAPGPIEWLRAAGLPILTAARLTAAVTLAITAVALWVLRRKAVEVLFGVAAVGSHLWTHHKGYDEVTLLLLAAPVAALAIHAAAAAVAGWTESIRTLLIACVALATALTVLHVGVPRRIGLHAFAAFQIVAWLMALYVLVVSGGDAVKPADDTENESPRQEQA